MQSVIIFGATGEIGRYLVDHLASLKKYKEKLYDITLTGRRETEFFDQYELTYYAVDLTKAEDMEHLPKKQYDTAIILSGVMPPKMEGYYPEKYLQTNILGIYHILNYCRDNNIERVIYAQPIRDLENYFENNEALDPYCPKGFSYKGDHAIYLMSKNFGMELLEHYYQEYGIKYTVLRLPTIYMYAKNPYYYIDGEKYVMGYRHIINQAMNGEEIEMWGDPSRAHDVLYVKDLCQLIEKAMLGKKDKAIYNAGTNIPISLEERIRGIIKVFTPEGLTPSRIKLCPNHPDSIQYTLDISNARAELGYEPHYDYISYLIDFKKEMEMKRFRGLS